MQALSPLWGNFASFLILSKAVTAMGLHTPSIETVWINFLARYELADFFSAQSLSFFLQACEEDLASILGFMSLLLSSIVTAFHYQIMDTLGSVCH